MLKKIVFAASAAAVVLGAGTAALAASGGSSAPPPSASGSASAPAKPGAVTPGPGARRGPKADRPGLRALGRALHAQWVTPDRDNKSNYITHNAIRGAVTAVSATSITVKAADGVSQTYAVTSDTKVHLRKSGPGMGPGKGQPGNNGQGNAGGTVGAIGDVHTGDKVAVTGTGTSSLTAQHIVTVRD
ncbi:MAG: hypothetical protein QOE23_2698 [Pseudonocardiales bacterium]|jgi:hypothetical protein|nr:hypothetical protein [Pseudonocardiales bacterium]